MRIRTPTSQNIAGMKAFKLGTMTLGSRDLDSELPHAVTANEPLTVTISK